MNHILQPHFKKKLIYRHHVEPLYLPKEETFPISMKYNDVTRTTHTSPDVMLEKKLKITGTWVRRIARCMDRIHKILFIERKAT